MNQDTGNKKLPEPIGELILRKEHLKEEFRIWPLKSIEFEMFSKTGQFLIMANNCAKFIDDVSGSGKLVYMPKKYW